MSNLLWKSLLVSPAVLGATVLLSGTAIAAPNSNTEVSTETEVAQQPVILAQRTDSLNQVQRYSNEGKGQQEQSQVTSVSQFSDVQPTDWAFQALQSLVERYGCIAGYPNGTYRGNRALTRYEFAAGLNACLDRVNELIATATADMVTRQDLATLQRLQEEFSAELATLRGRVDALEARTAELEANQFSTTTKLQGEAIFAVTDALNGDLATKTTFQNRVRLNLNTSFTGRDMLNTRLSAGNVDDITPTAEDRKTFSVDGNTGNDVGIDKLTYEAPVGPARVYIAATGGKHSHYAATNNPYFFDNTDGGNGALSTFSSENPIYRIGGGAGIALNVPFGQGGGILKPSSLTLGYMASEANDPNNGAGLFEGNYAALGQLNFNVGNRIALAATYVHGYHGTNSRLFDAGLDAEVVGTPSANTLSTTSASSSNSYGISAAFRPSQRLSISGFVSYHDIDGFAANTDYEAWSYGVGVALPDFGKQGNVLGIFGGAQPYSFNNVNGTGGNDIPYQVEGFYKYRVSDNISVTPGIIWLPSTGQNNNSEDTFIGTLRTTFTF
jgi:hypothetical protein